jgi:hypothetical protein
MPCPEGDILPPVVLNIYASDAQTIVVIYDENISVDGTYDGLSVASSSISGDTVTLSLASPLEMGTIYSVTISGTQDLASNAMQGYGVEVFYNTLSNLFFSEYAEGSSNNKYLEIYNASTDTVNLDFYAFPNVSNAPTVVGEYEFWNAFPAGAVIAPSDVFIIAHPSSDSIILAQADMTYSYLSNGDDGYALAYGTETDYVLIDFIGDFNGDPGSGWEVAGIATATQNHTLVRKCLVEQGNSDWTLSAGTNVDDSEWIVLEIDDWTDLGSHTTPCPEIILGCTDESASNFNATATQDDGSCQYLGCTDASAVNYDATALTDDGSCIYPLDPMVNLFFSEC